MSSHQKQQLKAIREGQIIINPELNSSALTKATLRRRRARLIVEVKQHKNQIIFDQNSSQAILNGKIQSQKIQKLPQQKPPKEAQVHQLKNYKPQLLPENRPYQECQICFADFKSNQLLSISNCKHKFCSQCLKGYLKNQIKMHKIAYCPNEGCEQKIDALSPFLKRLTPTEQQKYYNIHVYNNLSENQTLKICPTQNCEGFINVKQKPIICPICMIQFCQKCLFPKHKGPCDENAGLFLEDNYNFRKCQRCKMVLQKNKGCDHMTCKCGHQFCYLCGKTWASGHKCNQPQKMIKINQAPPTPPSSPLSRLNHPYNNRNPIRTNLRIQQPINPIRNNLRIQPPHSNAPIWYENSVQVLRNQQPNSPINIEIPNNTAPKQPLKRQIRNRQNQQILPMNNNTCFSSFQRALQCLIFYSKRILFFIFLAVVVYPLFLPLFLTLFVIYRLQSGCIKFATYSWKQQLFFNIFLYIYCVGAKIPQDMNNREQLFGVFNGCATFLVEVPITWICLTSRNPQA